jgi:hypothetical protein
MKVLSGGMARRADSDAGEVVWESLSDSSGDLYCL